MTPLRQGEWRQWFDQQMKLAKKQAEQGLYVSLRLDGRVRASGVGQPPWQILSAQLAPVTGVTFFKLTCLGHGRACKEGCLPQLRLLMPLHCRSLGRAAGWHGWPSLSPNQTVDRKFFAIEDWCPHARPCQT